MKKSDFYVIKSKVDDGYLGFYKPCPGLAARGDTRGKALEGIIEMAKKKEEAAPRLKQFADLQEEAQKDIPRLLAQLKKIEEKYERKRDLVNKHTYKITWSDDDNEYVGLCEKYPSLSWLDITPQRALEGIIKLVNEVEDSVYKTSEEWQKLCTIEVYDPDGWDRQGDFDYSWYKEKITRQEFQHRLFQSTCKYTKEYLEKGLWKDQPK